MMKKYLSFVKFSHTIFAMPFAMIGFSLGVLYGNRNLFSDSAGSGLLYRGFTLSGIIQKFLLVLACMIFARSAAMGFNRWLDQRFDALNPRTAVREIPAGVISATSALWFVIFNAAAFVITTWFINLLCFYLSFVALAVVLGYSYTKRFTALCHLILGIGLALAPIGAFLAVTGEFDLLPLLFSFSVIFWVSGFDIIYALQDEDFDRSQRLFSVPAVLGKKKALRVSEFLHVLSALSVIIAGRYGGFSLIYWIGVCVFIGMLIYQHSIVHPEDLSKVNIAFMTANGIASVVFAVFVITDLFFNV